MQLCICLRENAYLNRLNRKWNWTFCFVKQLLCSTLNALAVVNGLPNLSTVNICDIIGRILHEIILLCRLKYFFLLINQLTKWGNQLTLMDGRETRVKGIYVSLWILWNMLMHYFLENKNKHSMFFNIWFSFNLLLKLSYHRNKLWYFVFKSPSKMGIWIACDTCLNLRRVKLICSNVKISVLNYRGRPY